VRVEIWSDVVCPWCYIGKRRFATALARFAHRDRVTVEWRSFELHPDAESARLGDIVEPGDYGRRLAAKNGSELAAVQQHLGLLTDAARAEGLDVHFERVQPANSFAAHRVLQLALAQGVHEAAMERLFSGFFTSGEAIGDAVVLERLAGDVGLAGDDVRRALSDELYADAVRADQALARELGIDAVPCFVIERQDGLRGAQHPEQLLELLELNWRAGHG
jgi:predicted DsbA family dithiol-disulfide isomerase